MMRRNTKVLLAVTTLVAVIAGVAVWSIWLRSRGPVPTQGTAPILQETARLASVSVPSEPNSLAWSADGAYLAVGASKWTLHAPETSEVYVVDVGKQAIAATLKLTGSVEALSFSPDGKFLAAGSRKVSSVDKGDAELVVF